jgi:ketosteroid isomerase-like protein
MNSQIILTAVTTYFDRIQAMDLAGWRDLFAEDGVIYDPVGNPPANAQQRAEEFFGLLSRVFASIELAPDHIFVAGNSAAAKWTMRVVGKNQRSGQAEGISTFELNEDGKIQAVYAYWDDAALMQQLRG